MSTALKLATRSIQSTRSSLEDMETSQSQQAVNQPRQSHHHPERSPDQVSNLPRQHCHVAQILYAKDVYKDFPAWKEWVAINLYLPLFRFLHKRLSLFAPTRFEEPCRGCGEIKSTYSWLAHQGCYLTQQEADADAARYPHGYVVPNMPLGQSLTADVPKESSVYFASHQEDAPAPAVNLGMVRDEVGRLKHEITLAAVAR